MVQLTPQTRVLFAHSLRKMAQIVFVVFAVFCAISLVSNDRATAATSNTVNFQARLMNAAGSIVPDGNYNVLFKLYNAASGGTNLWTESYTATSGPGSTDVRVRVANGYLSVALGSITSFPGTIDWSQDLYLTMNIGGTGGSPSYDGEMSPRIHLTAVPYAFLAGKATQLAQGTSSLSFTNPNNGNSIALPDESGTICIQNSANCGFLTGSAASGSYVQLQGSTPGTAQTGNFNINGTGIAGTLLQSPSIKTGSIDTISAGTLTLGNTNATALALQKDTTITGTLTVTGVQPGSVSGNGTAASNSNFTGGKGGNTSGTTGQTAGAGASIGIYGGAGGDAGSGSTNGAGGSVFIRGGLPGSGAGTGNFHGNVILQDNGGYVGIGTLSPAAFLHISGSDTLNSDLLRITDSTTTAMDVFRVADEGATTVRTRTNTSTALQVQKSDGSSVFDVDTTNGRVGIGTNAPTRTFDVAVNNSQTTAPMALLEQAGTGDASLEFKTPTNSFIVGQDASDGSKFKISSSTANANTTFGNTLTSSSNPTNSQDFMSGEKVTTGPAGGTLTSINVRIGSITGTAHYSVAIYDNSAGQPNNLLASSASLVATASSVNSAPISATLAANTTYWLVVNSDSSSAQFFYDTGGTGTGCFAGHTYATAWPNPFGGCSGSPNGSIMEMYGVYAASGATYDSFGTSLFTLSDTGQAVFQNSANSTSAFKIQNAAGTNTVLTVDTTNNRIGINNTAPAYDLDVTGTINASSSLKVGGVTVCTVTGCLAGSGSGVTLQASTPGTADTGNFNITGVGIASSFLASSLDRASAGTLTLGGTTATSITLGANTSTASGKTFTANGATAVKVNSSTAFRVQNAAGSSTILSVNTSSAQVEIEAPVSINTSTTSAALTVQDDGVNGAPNLVLRGTSGKTTDYLDLRDNVNNYILSIGSGGQTLFQTTSNSTTGFQVQNSTSNPVFNVDTSNTRVGVGTNTPSRTFDVAVNNTQIAAPMALLEQAGTGDAALELKNSGSTSSFYISNDASNSNSLNINSYTAAGASSALPITIVQSTTNNTAGSGNSSVSKAFASNNTAGNLIVVAATWDSSTGGSTIASCQDTRGNTYSVVVVKNDPTNHQAVGICYAANIAAGSNTVTLNFPSGASVGSIAMSIHEYSGVATTSPLDVSASNNAVATTGTNAVTSTSATTTANGELIFGAVADTGGFSNTISAGTGTPNFTQHQAVSTPVLWQTQSKTQSSAGSVANTNTFTATDSYVSVMATFKAATSSSGVTDTNANSIFTLSQGGSLKLKSYTNSTTAFQVQPASSSTPILSVDTINNIAQIGSATSDSTGALLVLDGYNQSSDPTGVDGAMYYNSSMKAFRCYTNTQWHTCGSGVVFANTSVGASDTVSGTTTETSFGDYYQIPAGDCQPGRVYKIIAQGTVINNSGSNNTLTMRFKFSTPTILASTGAQTAMASSATTFGWRLEGQVTCINASASGSVEAQGIFLRSTGTGTTGNYLMTNTGTVGSIDLTTTKFLQVSAQWSAGNAASITMRQIVIEVGGP